MRLQFSLTLKELVIPELVGFSTQRVAWDMSVDSIHFKVVGFRFLILDIRYHISVRIFAAVLS